MFLSAYLVLAAISLVLLHDFFRKRSYRWKMLSKFPGDMTLPLIGNALQIGFDADETSHKLFGMWKRHGKQNFRVSLGSEDWVLVTEPDDVRIVLCHPTELSKPPERNAAMKPFFGDSVSSSVGERWRFTRKLITPSFHFKTLEQRVNTVNAFCDRLINILNQVDEKHPIDVYRYIKPLVFDILCTTLMGVDYNLLEDREHPYMVEGRKVINMITTNYYSYWRNYKLLFERTSSYREMMVAVNTLRSTSDNIIKERRKKLNKAVEDIKNNNINVNVDLDKHIQNKLSEDSCLLDDLLLSKLPNGDPTPDEMINEEITLILYSGHMTTTLTISHTLYLLTQNPKIQKKVLDEQREIFKGDMLRSPTNQDLNQMKYLEATLKECMRSLPAVTKIGRTLQDNLVLKDGRTIPAGASVVVFLEGLYHDPEVYEDPETFNPDRYLGSNLHPFAFVPFSAGPRNCVGFRYAWIILKSILSNILRRYEILEGGPGLEPQFKFRILTESNNGVHLRLRKRV